MESSELRVGQIWRNKRAKPTSVYLITKIEYYPELHRNDQQRVTGVLASDGGVQLARQLHESSLRRMFPYKMFDSYVPAPEEDK